jgi:hypothetical protein
MNIGCGRVSTADPHTEAQRIALERAGRERIYTETASGGQWNRPDKKECLKQQRVKSWSVLPMMILHLSRTFFCFKDADRLELHTGRPSLPGGGRITAPALLH